ncbi:ATP-binding protein [Phosphitispora sp. TUW77]|uniref:ATP-binding protein n=1 Tax=Phosphitispora sp. TUW77 TaxID=3152361 RepID=UPI003AB2D7F6
MQALLTRYAIPMDHGSEGLIAVKSGTRIVSIDHIFNLVLNGIESMSPGGVLTIKTYKDSNGVVLAVKDQGIGISHEVMEKIGTPFFTTKDYGTGLGLAACYRIAHRHKARIEIDTGTEGTEFKVIFPVESECRVNRY